jgi:cytochrome c oxidase assembly protein subunit 15
MASISTDSSRGAHRFAVITAATTVLLLMAGALVTSNDAADSVPDWPLAYHRLIPPWVGGIRFEFTHRVLAALVSILTLTLAVWIARTDRRPLAGKLGWTAFCLVIAQALLGGFRVLEGYPAISATAHATLAQIFFMTVVGLALYLSDWWRSDLPQVSDTGSPAVRGLAKWTTAAILAQLVLGAAFRHGAFGTSSHALDPHLFGSGIVLVMVILTGRVAKARFREMPEIRKCVALLHSFLGVQILLGLAAWWAVVKAEDAVQPTMTYVVLTVAHVLGGALTLAASVLLTLTCVRLIRPAAQGSTAAMGSHSTKQSTTGAGA